VSSAFCQKMDSEDENSCDEGILSNQLQFTTIIKEYPSLFEKSQLPLLKAAKTKAAESVILEWKLQTGHELDIKSLLKKIGNMKTFVKKKIDTNRTGNRKIILTEWEKQFADLLKPKTNPTLSKVAGKTYFKI